MNKTIKHSDSDPRYGFMIQDSDEYNIRIYPMGMNEICWDKNPKYQQNTENNNENEYSKCGLFVYSLSEDKLDDNISDDNISDDNNTSDNNTSDKNTSKKIVDAKLDYQKYKTLSSKNKCKLPDSEITEFFINDDPNLNIFFCIITIIVILLIIIIRF